MSYMSYREAAEPDWDNAEPDDTPLERGKTIICAFCAGEFPADEEQVTDDGFPACWRCFEQWAETRNTDDMLPPTGGAS